VKALAPIAIALFLVSVAPASASVDLLDTSVAIPRAVDTSCTATLRGAGDGVAHRNLTAPAAGYLTARLDGASGEWDLAVFKASGGPPVAGSTYAGAHEVASGYVSADDRLVVQACRRSGSGNTARLTADVEEIDQSSKQGPPSLVRVSTPSEARKAELEELGLDTTDRAGRGFADVVLHGDGDAAKLSDAGFVYKIQVSNLNAQSARDRAADQRVADSGRASLLPSGRVTYRRLFEITSEMHTLASANPDIVKLITLPHLTGEGRPVEGLEITTAPSARDGKPVFLMVGMHHAREWPSADIQMEWARQLISDYRGGVQPVFGLLPKVRTIVIPVTNADGYNSSRETGQTNGHGAGDTGFDGSNNEYRRKNCRKPTTGQDCSVVSNGVDPNRNYGAFWGGTGSPSTPAAETFRGPAPFSEPEVQDVRELIASRQVTGVISTHTFGRTILRQPGIASQPPTPDEVQYKQLGDSMAAQNGYTSEFSKDLYDHGGTTDAWSYFTTGALSFVFEMDSSAFHPPFSEVVSEYDGTGSGGNRGAFKKMMAFVADPAGHAVLTGTGPPGSVLRVARDVTTDTQEGPDVPDHLESTTVIPDSGQFEWHVNQSTQPLVLKSGQTDSWTLTCENPEGVVRSTQEVKVGRGQSLPVDVGPCLAIEKPGVGEPVPTVEDPTAPPVSKGQPSVKVKMSATVNRRVYRVRVKGSLVGFGEDSNRCAGNVSVTVTASGRRFASGRAPLDGACGFERSFKVKSRKSRKSLRAVAKWNGNDFLLGAERSATARVKKRRR
jgi:carboxypeptidase T